jgi:RNA polymerase sigma-70 factor (ECF subfamily)
MGLKTFNSLSSSIREFVSPETEGRKAGMHRCGPTVYGSAHPASPPFSPQAHAPGARSKIIQRIAPARLSDQSEEERMGDVDADETLVRQSRNGDAAAFEALVCKYQKMIDALTFRMTGSLSDAEDLTQETFIRAYEQIGSYRGTAKFSTWLCRIAVNTCLNWRRRESRRIQVHANCAETDFNQSGETEHAEAEIETSRRVQAALLKLPAKQRAAIVLTVYDGLNHAEAARVLGCSETTVSWRVFAARRKLKRWLNSAT